MMGIMGSDNPTGADNQQETEKIRMLDPNWVVGFVDGEGCFSVSVHRNAGAPFGWQLHPVFQVSQHREHRAVLEALVTTFRCGRVRSKGAHSSVDVFAVDSNKHIERSVIPFFEQHQLIVKAEDFTAFATIVRSLRRRVHHQREGFESLVRLAYGMNRRGRQRKRSITEIFEGSSETVRQAPLDER